MNIGIVCYASMGGSGILATELGKALADRGHDVHLISADLPFRLTEFHPGLDTSLVEAVFRKGAHSAAYSGFEGTDGDGTRLADWLRARGVSGVDIAGIATDYCVRATAACALACWPG